jgi:alpha-L-arabinofuranosidase
VVVGGLLISLLRHSDRVTAACQAQLVNVIAPIRSEPGGPAWRQTTYHPFALTSRLARGEVLQVALSAPSYETAQHGSVSTVDAVATHDAVSGEVVVFAVNRDRAAPVSVALELRGFDRPLRVVEAWVLADDDLTATNTEDAPDRVVPRPLPVSDGVIVLPPVSWSAVRLGPVDPQ